jgi:acyl-coenzyme A synthetase/AMP-(fatty) acid ligase
MNRQENAGKRARTRTTALGSLLREVARREFRIGRLFEEAARLHPGGTVLLDRPLRLTGSDQVRYTYAELADLVDDVAARFQRAGIASGEHLAVYEAAGFDVPVLACAAARAGAVPVLLSPSLAPGVVTTLLGRLDVPWIATDAGRLARLRAAGPPDGARAVLTGGDDTAGGHQPDGGPMRVERLAELSGAPGCHPVDLPVDRPALITHSSGTTGVPKLMVHTARTLWHRLLPQKLLAWPVRRRASVMLDMSFVHSRFFNCLGVYLPYGNPLTLLSDPPLDRVREMLVEVRPTLVEAPPNNFVLWEAFADRADAPLSSLKYYSSTFDAIHPGTVKRLLGASGHRRAYLLQLYGQSETGPLTGWLNTKRNVRRMDGRRVGRRLPGFTRVRVVDAAGHPVAPGVTGRLQARTRGRVRTYLGEEARYQEQVDDGWWYVGDMGWRDRRGRVYLADREVDKVGDIDSNLHLEDVLLERLPEMSEVVIVPDGDGRPTPIVATRGDRPLDGGRWKGAVAGLPALRPPVQWRFDDFPRTATWKVRRLEIRDLLRTGTSPRPVPARQDG